MIPSPILIGVIALLLLFFTVALMDKSFKTAIGLALTIALGTGWYSVALKESQIIINEKVFNIQEVKNESGFVIQFAMDGTEMVNITEKFGYIIPKEEISKWKFLRKERKMKSYGLIFLEKKYDEYLIKQ